MVSKTMREVFWAHRGLGSDKWEQYIPVYESALEPLLESGLPVSLLEIGVQNGGSLEVWKKLLPPHSAVVGIDKDERCRGLKLGEDISLHIGDAAQLGFINNVLGERCFDIIIDDGSHVPSDVISSFDILFTRLKPGGTYFIEDMHASYWARFGGGFRSEGSTIEWAKNLVDSLNVDHFEHTPNIQRAELARLQALNAQIAGLAFFDSMLVVQKHTSTKKRRFARLLTGTKFPVFDPFDWSTRTSTDRLRDFVATPSTGHYLDKGLHELLKKKDAITAQLEQEIQRQERKIKHQRKDIERKARQNRILLSSTSWRATAPLRNVANSLKSIARRMRKVTGPT